MTNRRYYNDSYKTRFSATIVENPWIDRKPAVILDETYFYPESGGQPFDLGTIQDVPVIGVLTRDSDNHVLHVLEKPIGEVEVVGVIDWRRRFDHMQQHTGQHILSQSFLRITDVETVSFHLGNQASTVDLDTNKLTDQELLEVERLANSIVWENRPITISYVPQADLNDSSLRKIPNRIEEKYRLVDIDKFDISACGGTHVSMTGEVGLIKITNIERRANQLRIEFLCGNRALVDYRQKDRVVQQLKDEFTTAADQLPRAIKHLKDEMKSKNREIKKLIGSLLDKEVDKLLQNSDGPSSRRIAIAVYSNRNPGELITLARKLSDHQHTIALLGNAGNKSQFVFSSSHDIGAEMDSLLSQVLPMIEGAKGGGKTNFAQGGGPPADENTVAKVLAEAKRLVLHSAQTRS